MSGIFTQSRTMKGVDCNGFGQAISYYSPSLVAVCYRKEKMSGTQTTTSYRSGGALEGLTLTNEQIMSNAFMESRPLDHGHEFNSQKRFLISSHAVRTLHGTNGAFWQGQLSTSSPTAALNKSNYIDPPTANYALGTQAIANVATAAPVGDVTDALLQILQDGIPKVIGSALLKEKARTIRNSAKNAGEEYLNYQFGWVPFLSDIRQCLNAVVKSKKLVQQYVRDAGKPVRRRYTFPTSISTSITNSSQSSSMSSAFGPDATSITSNDGHFGSLDLSYGLIKGYDRLGYDAIRRTTLLQRDKTWFSGSFMYSLPVDSSWIGKFNKYADLANHVLGIELTPDVLWDLAPWSWLVDWIADVGYIVKNATLYGYDGQVLRYGYLMQHSIYDVMYETIPNAGKGFMSFPTLAVTDVYRSERKQRLRATPFGFGLNVNSFSANQWAILGSLGLVLGPKRLP